MNSPLNTHDSHSVMFRDLMNRDFRGEYAHASIRVFSKSLGVRNPYWRAQDPLSIPERIQIGTSFDIYIVICTISTLNYVHKKTNYEACWRQNMQECGGSCFARHEQVKTIPPVATIQVWFSHHTLEHKTEKFRTSPNSIIATTLNNTRKTSETILKRKHGTSIAIHYFSLRNRTAQKESNKYRK